MQACVGTQRPVLFADLSTNLNIPVISAIFQTSGSVLVARLTDPIPFFYASLVTSGYYQLGVRNAVDIRSAKVKWLLNSLGLLWPSDTANSQV